MQQQIENIMSAMRNGRHADALSMSRTLAQSFPRDEGVRSLLAVSEQNGGSLSVSRDILLDLTREHPATWQHWNNLGNVERQLGDLSAAGAAYAQALQLNPDSTRLRANYGLLQLNLGNFGLAREELCKACSMDGAESSMRVWAAVACQASADDDTARQLVQGWMLWKSELSDEALLELGWLLTQLGDYEAGESILATEFLDSAHRARALTRRIMARERLNQLDEAVALAARLQDPARIADIQARMETLKTLALLSRRTRDFAASRKYYEDALSLDVPQRYKQPLYFGLARACDELGEPAAAMEALSLAHAVDLSSPVAAERDRLAGTGLLALAEPQYQLTASQLWQASENPSEHESPIFVVGFPRSGTTLLEQMLGAHESLVTADEKPMVQRMLESLNQGGTKYPADLAELGEPELEQLREVYWQEARVAGVLRPDTRLVDKHPLNFLALPLIRRVFPNSHLIFCRRHPCDSILSSYMQDFRDPRLAAECASLQRLSELFVRLAQRWKQDSALLPGRNLVCNYEEMVTDADQQLQRIGTFLGIDDVSAMHQFGEHARARGFIGTPSYSQVVQGLNSDAIGRWTQYREYFTPVLPILAPILEEWGYEV
jgi:tetratricopeptide (TPR) repeat protein